MSRIKILGSGDAFHSGGRFQTSFLLNSNNKNILIDCGCGSLQQMKKFGYSTNEINSVIISHFHGDHIAGLPFLLMDMARLNRQSPLYIFSPEGGKQKINDALKLFYPGNETILESLQIEWLYYENEKSIKAAGIEVQPFKMNHAELVKPHGIRVTIDGKVISYSGDTGWNENLLLLSEDADLFICECTFYDKEMEGHLNYKLLSEKKHLLHYKQILLTHFDEEMLLNADKVDMEMATDGMDILIS